MKNPRESEINVPGGGHGGQSTRWKRMHLYVSANLRELCCASGRLNSLPMEEDMTILLPNMQEEVPEVSMINVMVSFAQIAREVSSRIYIRRRTLAEKATAALELDAKLVEWRETLPGYLHKDRNSLRQPDFVNKQSTP
jgi:hypothetical protein